MGSQMDHGIEALVWKEALANVALVEPDALGEWIGRRQVIEGRDFVALIVEVPDNVGADEAG